MTTAGRRYAYPDRAGYADALTEMERRLTLHRQALDCLLREEFTFTAKYNSPTGAWFMMGVARASGPSGGMILVREYYPTNLKPSQSVYMAETWLREMGQHFVYYRPGEDDPESRAFRDCFYECRSLYNVLSK